jgi:hypothetical protein
LFGEERRPERAMHYDAVIDRLGGGMRLPGWGKSRAYSLASGEKVLLRYSKHHAKDKCYYFAISPDRRAQMEREGIQSVVFILGSRGFARVPTATMQSYLEDARTQTGEDGGVVFWAIYVRDDSDGGVPALYHRRTNAPPDIMLDVQSL